MIKMINSVTFDFDLKSNINVTDQLNQDHFHVEEDSWSDPESLALRMLVQQSLPETRKDLPLEEINKK